MTTTKQIWDEDPVILAITLVSISITLIGDAIRCALTLHTPKAKQLGAISVSTKCTKTSKAKSRQLSASTNAECSTEDQKKAVGTTNVASQSEQSVVSPRNKQSKPQLTSKPTPGQKSVRTRTTLVGQPSGFVSTTTTPKRTRKQGLITNKEQQ